MFHCIGRRPPPLGPSKQHRLPSIRPRESLPNSQSSYNGADSPILTATQLPIAALWDGTGDPIQECQVLKCTRLERGEGREVLGSASGKSLQQTRAAPKHHHLRLLHHAAGLFLETATHNTCSILESTLSSLMSRASNVFSPSEAKSRTPQHVTASTGIWQALAWLPLFSDK